MFFISRCLFRIQNHPIILHSIFVISDRSLLLPFTPLPKADSPLLVSRNAKQKQWRAFWLALFSHPKQFIALTRKGIYDFHHKQDLISLNRFLVSGVKSCTLVPDTSRTGKYYTFMAISLMNLQSGGADLMISYDDNTGHNVNFLSFIWMFSEKNNLMQASIRVRIMTLIAGNFIRILCFRYFKRCVSS